MRKKLFSIVVLAIVSCTSIQANELELKNMYTSGMSVKVNEQMIALNNQYSEISQLMTIGFSAVEKTPIQALKLGKGERCILIHGAHHARESLTTILVMAQMEDLAKAYYNNEMRQGYAVRQLLDTVSIYFVPMVNPDGIELAMGQKPSWKANGRGVDLNRNYPTPYAKTVPITYPASQGYAGPYPFSEPETQALKALCDQMQFETAIAYHSAGQIIYWWYHQTEPLYSRSLENAQLLARTTGYSLVPIAQQKGGLGFTDWFIQEYKRPSFTLEIGKLANGRPLAWSEYEKVWTNNREVPLKLLISVLKQETKPWHTVVEDEKIEGELIFGRGMVPLREAAKILDLDITYNALERKIQISSQGNQLYMTLGEKTALYNGEMITLVMPTYIKQDTTYVPLKDLLTYCSGEKEESDPKEIQEVPTLDIKDTPEESQENKVEEKLEEET